MRYQAPPVATQLDRIAKDLFDAAQLRKPRPRDENDQPIPYTWNAPDSWVKQTPETQAEWKEAARQYVFCGLDLRQVSNDYLSLVCTINPEHRNAIGRILAARQRLTER